MDDYIPAMLAKETSDPFSDKDWLYEIKWDGYRAIAEVNKNDVKLYSRNGNSFVYTYPDVVDELKKMKLNAVLDGEVVVLNEEGNPDFQKLQHYDAYRHLPLVYYVFDLLELNEKKLYSLPLIERKQKLQEIIKDNPVVKYSDHIEERGEDFFEVSRQKDIEGIMAKRSSSQYYPGKRTQDWLKIKHHKSDEAIIAGFTAPRGGRKYFGALVLGSYVEGKLTYIGHTGSGFDATLLKEVDALLQPIITNQSPFNERVKTNMPVTWVQPKYVCEIKFSERTSDGKLRHPIFLRLRDDKTASDLNSQNKGDMKKANKLVKKVAKAKTKVSTGAKVISIKGTAINHSNEETKKKAAAKKEVKPGAKESKVPNKDVVENEKGKTYKIEKAEIITTNRTKIYFPEDGVTKGDVIDYYEQMADLILPYIKDRPQSLFRTPNGINQKGFFQKDAGEGAPSWVKHQKLFSESTNKDIDYIQCNDKATLLYLANLGCIEINPWHSRMKSLDKPDYLIIDIDPSDNNTFEHVIEAANIVKGILDQAGAYSICKTSGSSGLHIYVPLAAKYSYDQAKDFAYLICMMANQLIPDFTTLERNLTKRRKDQIYMDYLQNRKGQTIACVYSLRPKKGATVSTPLEWSEVKQGLSPRQFTIHNISQRLKAKGDLFAPMLDKANAIDLGKCLERLGG